MEIPRFDPLRTNRLVVRPMTLDDVDALHERRNDATTAALQSWEVPYPRAKAVELVEFMVALDGVPPDDGWFQLAIDDRETGEALGDLALHLTFGGRSAEVGYTLSPAARGRGLATEAVDGLITWLVDVLGVSRVSAMMHPDNRASIRVGERAGMVFEGRTKNSYWVGDDVSDDVLYGMTPSMWRAWHGRSRSAPDSVRLTEVTHDNLAAVCGVELHRSQERLVAPVASWFASIVAPPVDPEGPGSPRLQAIEADGEIVGALMTTTSPDASMAPEVVRIAIDRMHQHRGIGRRARELL